jgi:hypothetical protein
MDEILAPGRSWSYSVQTRDVATRKVRDSTWLAYSELIHVHNGVCAR